MPQLAILLFFCCVVGSAESRSQKIAGYLVTYRFDVQLHPILHNTMLYRYLAGFY